MAFDDILPKNSESRCIAISIKLLKKNAPHIKWIISYSDASQCGDGSIYRASGFDLIGIKVNKEILQLQNGKRINVITLNTNKNLPGQAKPVEGFQLKYIYFLDPAKRADLAHPIIPFSKIDEMGAGMYRGEKITLAERKIIRDDSINGNAPDSQSGEDVRGDLVAQTPNP
jgi:hypothetical protein